MNGQPFATMIVESVVLGVFRRMRAMMWTLLT